MERTMREAAHRNSAEEQTIETLMDRYGADVWNYAYFLTRDTEMADDVSQEVFIKCYHRLDTFKGQSAIKTWLFAIARNTAFSFRKSRYYRYKSLTDLFSPHQSSISDGGRVPSAERQYMDREHVHEIWDIIMSLPDRFREVLVLDLKFDMTIEDISLMTGLPSGTIKSRLYRARKKVQMRLRGKSDEGK